MEWIIHLELTEASKIRYFYNHLKSNLKDSLAHCTNAPMDSLKSYSDWVIAIDNRRHQCNVEKKCEKASQNLSHYDNSYSDPTPSIQSRAYSVPVSTSTSTFPSSPYITPYTPATTTATTPEPTAETPILSPGEPMQIDAFRAKP